MRPYNSALSGRLLGTKVGRPVKRFRSFGTSIWYQGAPLLAKGSMFLCLSRPVAQSTCPGRGTRTI